jgi:hypothetical protein
MSRKTFFEEEAVECRLKPVYSERIRDGHNGNVGSQRPFVRQAGSSPRAIVAAVATALLSAACGSNGSTASPAAPTTTAPTTETFASVLTAKGAAFRTFTVSQAGTVSITLVSDGPPTIPFGLGLGIRIGATGCNLAAAVNTMPGDTAQITAPVDPGSYCAGIYDIGNIGSGEVNFSVRIVHP